MDHHVCTPMTHAVPSTATHVSNLTWYPGDIIPCKTHTIRMLAAAVKQNAHLAWSWLLIVLLFITVCCAFLLWLTRLSGCITVSGASLGWLPLFMPHMSSYALILQQVLRTRSVLQTSSWLKHAEPHLFVLSCCTAQQYLVDWRLLQSCTFGAGRHCTAQPAWVAAFLQDYLLLCQSNVLQGIQSAACIGANLSIKVTHSKSKCSQASVCQSQS